VPGNVLSVQPAVCGTGVVQRSLATSLAGAVSDRTNCLCLLLQQVAVLWSASGVCCCSAVCAFVCLCEAQGCCTELIAHIPRVCRHVQCMQGDGHVAAGACLLLLSAGLWQGGLAPNSTPSRSFLLAGGLFGPPAGGPGLVVAISSVFRLVWPFLLSSVLRELRACCGNVLLALRSVLSLGCAALFVSSGVSAAPVSSEVLAAQPAKAG
jgi:hypothetical protein